MENLSRIAQQVETQLTLPGSRPNGGDVFDQEEFNAVRLINQIFPDGGSLRGCGEPRGLRRAACHCWAEGSRHVAH